MKLVRTREEERIMKLVKTREQVKMKEVIRALAPLPKKKAQKLGDRFSKIDLILAQKNGKTPIQILKARPAAWH